MDQGETTSPQHRVENAHVEPLRYAYKLTVLGDPKTLKGYRDSKGQMEMNKIWNPEHPFVLRRRSFPKNFCIQFPDCNRLSRKHLDIICRNESDMSDSDSSTTSTDYGSFWVNDLSANGTLLNGKVMGKNSICQLKDGDELGILWKPITDTEKYHLCLGLKFNIFPADSAPVVPHPSQEFLNAKKEDKKRKRLSEPDDSEERKMYRLQNGKGYYDSDDDDDLDDEDLDDEAQKKSDRFIKQWSTEEEEKLVKVMKKHEGSAWRDIAEYFPHRSPDAVRNKFKKMSEQEKSPIKKQGIPKSLAKPKGFDPVASPEGKPKKGKKGHEEDRRRKLWTPEEDEKLKELILNHPPICPEDWDHIAAQLGRTVKSVKHKYNDYKLYNLTKSSSQ